MQIVPFLTHYQLVYTNFDFSSFSLISYVAKVWFLVCKKGVFTLQKYGFYFLASALLQCCDILAAFYSVYFLVAITILVFPRCVRFVCLCCQKPVAFVPFVPSQFCLLFVPHGQ